MRWWPCALVLASSLAAAEEVDPAITSGLDAAVKNAPACTAKHCIPIHLHVASGDHTLVVDPEWIDAQLATADKHFAAIDVGFTIAAIDRESAMRVTTREDRNGIVGKGLDAGRIDVYIVFRLDNIDDNDVHGDGEIRGVTWHRKDDKKYVIVSMIAGERTLAHELGHFFGLPHSTYAISIMNKKPREEPPQEQRTFHPDEIETMKGELKRLLKEKVVVEK